MKVLETFIRGKISDELCEDAFYISDNFAAVIDGVTSKSDFTHMGKTTGRLGADIVLHVLENAGREAAVEEIIHAINLEIEQFYQSVEFPYSISEKGIQAVCAIYSEFYHEIWLIGDCQVSVDGKNYLNPKKSDTILAQFRSFILKLIKYQQKNTGDHPDPNEVARETIEPWILKSSVFANNADSDFGYAVINGRSIPRSLIKTISLDRGRHEIVLTTDGYPQIMSDLKHTEAYLEKIIHEDKDCETLFLSTKGVMEGQLSFDDRTYLRFLI